MSGIGSQLLKNPFAVYVPGRAGDDLVPRWYFDIQITLPWLPRDHFLPRSLPKDPFLASSQELTPFSSFESALILPLDRAGTREGFILLPNPSVIDLKDPGWLLCWESFYEEFKHFRPEPWPVFKSDLENLIAQSARISSHTEQILIRIPLTPLLGALLTLADAGTLDQEGILETFLPLVSSRGAVGATENYVFLLFPKAPGLASDLYVVQCQDFIQKNLGVKQALTLEASVLDKPFTPGEW